MFLWSTQNSKCKTNIGWPFSKEFVLFRSRHPRLELLSVRIKIVLLIFKVFDIGVEEDSLLKVSCSF